MWLLDVLAVVLLYAFVMPYVWVSLAFAIAAFRVRKVQPSKRFRGLLGYAFASLTYLIWPLYALFLLRDSSEWWYPIFWYSVIFLNSVWLVSGQRLTRKVIPLHGYE